MTNICTIWWWTAQAWILNILQSIPEINWLTWIVCTTDNGWSSKIVRESLWIPSPWDVRNCINKVSRDDSVLNSLLNYRFRDGELSWTHVWNIIIWALSQIYWWYDQAIKIINKELRLETHILPVSGFSTQICAQLEDGSSVTWEREIIKRENPSPITSFYLEDPSTPALLSVCTALEKADYIIVCPWVLGTAIISTLLHTWIKEAIDRNTKAKLLYFWNIFSYPNQTDWRTLSDHVNCLQEYLPRKIDHLIVNTSLPPQEVIEYYKQRNHELVPLDLENIAPSTIVHSWYFLEDIEIKSLDTLERASNKKQHVGTHVIKADKKRVSKVINSILHH